MSEITTGMEEAINEGGPLLGTTTFTQKLDTIQDQFKSLNNFVGD